MQRVNVQSAWEEDHFPVQLLIYIKKNATFAYTGNAREENCKYNEIISKNYKFKLFFHLLLVYDIIFIESYLLFCERFTNI